MAKQATPAVVATPVVAAATPVVETAQGVGRWAREAARAAAGQGRAGNRFYGIAIALIEAAPAKGQTARLSFEAINKATGKKRGEGANNPRAAWVRALSAVGELHGAGVESGVLALPLASGATLQIRVIDETPARAYELRTV